MPTTRYSLVTLSFITLIGLAGCNGSQPVRSSIDTESSPPDKSESSETLVAEWSWLKDSLLQADHDSTPTTKTWFYLDPYMPEASEASPDEENWRNTADSAEKRPEANVNTLAEIDLWTRIRQGFELTPVDNSLVRNQLKWYQENPDHLTQIEERARPYLYYIVEALEKRGLPMELALLPAIESAFIPTAYSSQNAAGIWQFMPSTGKMLGLEQNWWYDGRLDVVAATDAALDYLQSLATLFDGDWKLALAAYNSGEGTVNRAIRKNREQGKSTDYWSLDLPPETKRYVPQLLALAKVVEQPEAFGTRLATIPNQPFFDSVDIEAQLDLTLAAKMADITVEELQRLNPGFHRLAMAPRGPHRLVLPLENIEQFMEKLAELDPDKHPGWTKYIIQPGDNLGTIARQHGITVDALKQANSLKGNNILAGKRLFIPGSQRIAGRPLPAAGPRQPPVDLAGGKTIYTVRNGDSLWTIAKKHNIDHKLLARWNSIAVGDTLRPGQKLTLLNNNLIAEVASVITGQTAVR